MNKMCNVIGMDIVFENCEQVSIEANNVLSVRCDNFKMSNRVISTELLHKWFYPKSVKLRLSYNINKRIFDRIQEYHDISYIKIITDIGSIYIEVPYSDEDKSNKLLYFISKIKELFKEDILLGENVYQKNSYHPDYFQISIKS